MLTRACLVLLTLALTACHTAVKPTASADAPFLPAIADLREVTTFIDEAPRPVLLVLDIDDTLLSTPRIDDGRAFYGSDRWYRWQDAQGEGGKYRVPCLFPVLQWNSEVLRLEAVQLDAADIINALAADRAIVTSRGGDQRPGTERELAVAGYHLGAPLAGLENVSELPGKHSPMTYRNGIFMTGGTPKGPALKALLDKASTAYRSVVMVDDDSKNLRSVADSLAASSEAAPIGFFGLRYTGIKGEPVPAPTPAEVMAAQESWLVWKGWMRKYEPERAAKLLNNICK